MKAASFAASVGLALFAIAAPSFAADTGIELQLRGAFGNAGKGSPITYDSAQAQDTGSIFGGGAKPYGVGFEGEISAGYRFLKIFSAGLAVTFRKSGSSDVDDQQSVSRGATSVGPYARFYVPNVPILRPWFSVGIEYVHDEQTYNRPFQGLASDWTLTHNGVGLPMTLGLDYDVFSSLSIGLSLRVDPVINAGGCVKVAAQSAAIDSCTDSSPKIVKGSSYMDTTFGLHARVTL